MSYTAGWKRSDSQKNELV